MTPMQYVNEVKTLFTGLADPAKALKMSAYLKHQFPFLGIATPQRREALKSLNQTDFTVHELFEIAESLWLLPEREYRYAAIDLLARKSKKIQLSSIPRLLNLVQREPWWETVDGLTGVIGDVIAHGKKTDTQAQAMMDDAIAHHSLWVRRVAITHQLGWRLNTDEARLFRYATTSAAEKDFFIRKAIGWALRDYARWNPAAVKSFVAINGQHLSSLTIREAIKHIGFES